jgi:DNA-binding GntR family transcriptional regulator
MVTIYRQLLTDHVYQYLIGQLRTQRLPIGSHLNALAIAEELSTSRSTVSKAISRLVDDGWVRPDHNRRPVLIAYPPAQAVNPAEISFTFSNQTEQTYEALLERLLRGAYPPGETLKERRLAKELGVNPVTVHRACEWLCNDGLVERLRRRGWQVVALHSDDLREIYRLRVLLEPLAMPEAAVRIDDGILDELDHETDRLLTIGEQATAYERRRADYRLHRAIYEASGNRILGETVDPLIRKALIITTVGFRYTRAVKVLEEHKQIIEALRERNAARAAKHLKDHIASAAKFNISAFDRKK